MTLARLLRCHPFGTSGIDNVPAELPVKARWYLPWRYGRWSWRSLDAQSRW
jgi:putative component of membrane protein insertase Oxa1/YidC/SpoIIIJ protein YidD